MRNPVTDPVILAFDTALSGCGVAILKPATNDTVSELRPMTRGQSELLVPMVGELMDRAGVDYPDLGLIVTTTGPGAFTGLRIGLSAARSFGLALDIPVAGVTTTAVLAKKFVQDHAALDCNFLIIIETKRSDLYLQHFKSCGEAVEEAGVSSIEDLFRVFGSARLMLCGDGVSRLRETLDDNWPESWVAVEGYEFPDPAVLAEIGLDQFRTGNLQPANPIYLRDADVSVSTRIGRTIAPVWNEPQE